MSHEEKFEKSATAVAAVFDQDNWSNTTNPKANQAAPGGNPFVEFGGQRWWVNYWWSPETGTYAYGDGGTLRSNFDPKQFFKLNQDGTLTLRAFGTEKDKCITSEIVSEEIVGYGDYLITVKADQGSFAELDPNVVFGLFTYQWGEAPPEQGPNRHREIDLLETISKEAQGRPGNAQFALQPALALPEPNLLKRFTLPDIKYITAVLHRPDPEIEGRKVTMRIFEGDHTYDDIMRNPELKPLETWNPVIDNFDPVKIEPYVPLHTSTSRERFHINLYLNYGMPPAKEQSVTLIRFERHLR